MVVKNISRRLEARVRHDYPSHAADEVVAFLLTVSEDHADLRQDAERLQALHLSCSRGMLLEFRTSRCSCKTGGMVSFGQS